MRKEPLGAVLEYLRKVCAKQELQTLGDAELLQLFRTQRDNAPFAVLMHRHGPMVLGVCQRVLGDYHCAEEALQATFVILARRAGSIKKQELLANWLYGVAKRVALKARAQRTARQSREQELVDMPRAETLDDVTWQELRPVLDEEIAALPEKCRAPIVLCYLEGKSYDQAARELGWPKSSLASRLARGRELLRQRLIQRGLAISAAALTTVLTQKTAGAAVGGMLVINTAKAAASVAAGKTLMAGVLSANALRLAEEVMLGMAAIKTKLVLVVLASLLALGGAGLAAHGTLMGSSNSAPPTNDPSPKIRKVAKLQSDAEQPPAAARDSLGDPLPAGAIARLGTLRMRVSGNYMYGPLPAPDGKIFATGGASSVGRISLWDSTTGKEVRRLTSGNFSGQLLAFSPDGKLFAEVRDTRDPEAFKIRFWNVQNGEVVKEIDDETRMAAGTFIDGGKTLLGISARGLVIWWDFATGKRLKTWLAADGLKPPATSKDGTMAWMRFGMSADGTRVIAAVQWNDLPGHPKASTNVTLCALDTKEQKVLWHFERKSGFGSIAAVSPNGDMLANCLPEGTWELREVVTGKLIRTIDLKVPKWWSQSSIPMGVGFSSDGKYVAIGDMGIPAQVWDTASGKKVQEFELQGADGSLRHLWRLAFLPGGKRLLAAYDDQVICWDVATGKESFDWPGHRARVSRLQFSADGKQLVSGSGDLGYLHGHEAVVWDTQNWKEIARNWYGIPLDIGYWTSAAANLSVGLGAGRDGTLLVYDFATSKSVRPLDAKPVETSAADIYFSPSGKLAFVARWGDKTADAGVFDVASGKKTCDIVGSVPMVSGNYFIRRNLPTAVFSPDDKHLLWHDDEGTIHIVAVDTGKDVRQFTEQKSSSFRFSVDGKYLAILDRSSSQVVIRQMQDGRIVRVLPGSGTELDFRVEVCLEFSPDGRMLAVSGRDNSNEIELWEVASGKIRARLAGHEAYVASVAFSPDGRLLASGSRDTTVLVWDLRLQRFAPGKKAKF